MKRNFDFPEIFFMGFCFVVHIGSPYYRSVSSRGFKYLHRLLWEQYRGTIPKGFEIHHKDGNPIHNQISNLDVIESRLHKSSHTLRRLENLEYREKRQTQLALARLLAPAWHASEKGREWHRDAISKQLAKMPLRNCICPQCRKPFTTVRPEAKFCNYKCKNNFNGRRYRLEKRYV